MPISNVLSRTRPLAAVLLVSSLAGPAAAGPGTAPAPGSRNVYTAGGEVRPGPVAGDLMAAGGRIVVEQPVGGDAALAAGAVDLRARIAEDLRVVGGAISVEDQVGGDLFAAGASISLRPQAVVAGTADLSGASITVQGRIDGALRARGQTIRIDGEVRGPARLAAERIELGPQARLLGPLTYRSPVEISRAEGAVLAGPVTREASTAGSPASPQRQASGGVGVPGFVLMMLAVFAFSALLLGLLPRFTAGAAARLRASPWASLGVGLAAVLGLPLLAVLMFITVFGIPLGMLMLAAYPVLLLAGFVLGVFGLTLVLPDPLRRWAGTGRTASRLGAFAVVLVAVSVLGLVPIAGGLLVILLGLAGLGAGVLQLRANRVEEMSRPSPATELPPPGRDAFPA